MSALLFPRGGLLLAALLAAQAQAANLVVCSEASPEGFDIVQYTAATTADATAETLFERLVAFAPGSTDIVPALAQSWETVSYTHLRPRRRRTTRWWRERSRSAAAAAWPRPGRP